VFLGCADSHLVDRPRGHRRPSARCLTAQLFFVFMRVLERLSFDPFCRWVFGAEVCRRFVLECRTVCDEADGLRVHHGQFIFLGVVLEVRVAFSDGPCPPHGQSVHSSRTICPDTADGPPGAFKIA
jgi:hypothetical protein